MLIVKIVNRTPQYNHHKPCEYSYEVFVNNTKIDEGRVEHYRKTHYSHLLSRIATNAYSRWVCKITDTVGIVDEEVN